MQRDTRDSEARRYKVRVLAMNILCSLGVSRNSLKWSHKDERSSEINWKWPESPQIILGAVFVVQMLSTNN